MTVICIVARLRGVPVSSLFHVGDDHSVSAWQALLFSVSMAFFGAYFGPYSTLPSARFWEAPVYTQRLKIAGWIVLVGGIAVTVKVLGELTGVVPP
jgi:hypothetical protein